MPLSALSLLKNASPRPPTTQEKTCQDPFVRHWRPLFGHMIALTWDLQTAAIAFAMISESPSSNKGKQAERQKGISGQVLYWVGVLARPLHPPQPIQTQGSRIERLGGRGL